MGLQIVTAVFRDTAHQLVQLALQRVRWRQDGLSVWVKGAGDVRGEVVINGWQVVLVDPNHDVCMQGAAALQ